MSGPCFVPGCPCCSVHTPLERKYEYEIERLRKALEEFAQLAWEGGDIDGGDFQDTMVRYELMVEVPASEEFREEWDSETMYILSWTPDRDALKDDAR